MFVLHVRHDYFFLVHPIILLCVVIAEKVVTFLVIVPPAHAESVKIVLLFSLHN